MTGKYRREVDRVREEKEEKEKKSFFVCFKSKEALEGFSKIDDFWTGLTF